MILFDIFIAFAIGQIETAHIGIAGAVLVVLALLGALKAKAQIYIDSYRFGVVAIDTCIFPTWNALPYDSDTLTRFRQALQCMSYTQTNDTATFGSLTGNAKWTGGVLAPNGKIYGIPSNSISILEIDPSVTPPTTATFGSLAGNAKWTGGVLAPNGKIYAIPEASVSILEIDPSVTPPTTATFGSLAGATKWTGGVLAPNGKIYGIPYNSVSILEIDPSVTPPTTATFGSLTGNAKWFGGVLAPNGKIYGIPYAPTSILEILSTVSGLSTNMPLSRHLNKF